MKRKKVIALLLVASMTFGGALPVMADDNSIIVDQEIQAQTQSTDNEVDDNDAAVRSENGGESEPQENVDTLNDIVDNAMNDTEKEIVNPVTIEEPAVYSEESNVKEGDIQTQTATVGEQFEEGDFTYKVTSDTTVSVIEYSLFASSDMVIPQQVEHEGIIYQVTGVKECNNFRNIETITIPVGVVEIGENVFRALKNLRSIDIQDPSANCVTVDGIMYSSDMTELRLYPAKKEGESYITPESVRTIKSCAIGYTQNLKTLIFSNNVAVFEDGAVDGLQATQSIVLGTGTTKIGQGNFTDCDNLQELTLQGRFSIGTSSIENCPKLKKITLNGNITSWLGYVLYNLPSLEEYVVTNSTYERSVEGALYNGNVLMRYPANKAGDTYVVPEGTTEISALAFSQLQNLKKIIVTPGAKLGAGAFNSPVNILDVFLRDEESVNIGTKTSAVFLDFPAGSHVYGKNQAVIDSIKAKPFAVDEGISVEIGSIPATSVTVDATTANINVGESKKLNATIAPYYATENVTWSSADNNIATVDPQGNVTAVKAGTVKITATAGKVSTECIVTVKSPLKGISLDKTTASLKKGDSTTLKVNYNPADTTDSKDVIWSTSDSKVATVKDGKVTAVAKGTATITAKAGNFTATCLVSVGVPMEGITISKDAVTVNKGESTTLIVGVLPEDTTDSKTVTWYTSNGNVATVKDGKVTAVDPGSATITAKVGSFTKTCTVTVKSPMTGIALDKTTVSLQEGGKDTLKVTLIPANATDDTKVIWSSSNSNVVTVVDGNLEAKSAGSATITAKAGNYSATCTVTVAEFPISYPDVAKDAWYYESAKWAAQSGVMTGYDNGKFGPADLMSRGQMATILYRIEGKPATSFENVFPDVADGTFYSIPAVWANQNKVMTGYDNGKFGAMDSVTREQLATMLFRYAKSEGYDTSARADLSRFPDANSVTAFAKEAMAWAVAEGIISGDQGKLNPQGNSYRAVAATVMMRYANAYK